jgi:hypothetical protein
MGILREAAQIASPIQDILNFHGPIDETPVLANGTDTL